MDIDEHPALAISGWLGVVLLAGCVVGMVFAASDGSGLLWLPLVVSVLVIISLVIVTPGQTSVVQFFGRYAGTVRRPGFWRVSPLTVPRRVSVRVRNFETNHLKVNDADGNPVEIAAIVVWQVADTAKSTYAVDSYQDFVSVQSESALRHVTTSHPYDDTTGTGTSLRGSTDVVAAGLARELASWSRSRSRDRRRSHLPPRIRPRDRAGDASSSAGQRRRRRPVPDRRGGRRHGRVGAQPITENGVVTLDEERTAAMVSNLMVVLCGDQPPSPTSTWARSIRERTTPGPAPDGPRRPRRADPLGERRVPERRTRTSRCSCARPSPRRGECPRRQNHCRGAAAPRTGE